MRILRTTDFLCTCSDIKRQIIDGSVTATDQTCYYTKNRRLSIIVSIRTWPLKFKVPDEVTLLGISQVRVVTKYFGTFAKDEVQIGKDTCTSRKDSRSIFSQYCSQRCHINKFQSESLALFD